MICKPVSQRRPLGRQRRGATLVIVALMIVVLGLMTALVVEAARLQGISQRLSTVADAAALSAIIDLRNASAETLVRSNAEAMLPGNPVVQGGGATLGPNTSGIVPGTWAFGTRTFTPSSWAQAQALRVTASYSAPWTIGRLFGGTSSPLTRTAVVTLGSIRTSRCVKPLAVPYSHLKATLGYSATDTTSLTGADVARLITNRRTMSMSFIQGNSNGEEGTLEGTRVPGMAYAVKLGVLLNRFGQPSVPQSTTGSDFIDDMSTSCGSVPPVSVGDWLEIYDNKTVKKNDLQRAINAICGWPGNAGAPQSKPCTQEFVVPVWSGGPQVVQGGSGPAVRVRYLAIFQMTGYSASSGISGYYTALTRAPQLGSEGVVEGPGPIGVPLLVR